MSYDWDVYPIAEGMVEGSKVTKPPPISTHGVYLDELLPWKKKWWQVKDIGQLPDGQFCILLVRKESIK